MSVGYGRRPRKLRILASADSPLVSAKTGGGGKGGGGGRTAPALSEPVLPTVTPTMQVRVDASQITGKADTNRLDQWNDVSGNNRHLVQGTDANRPTYRTGQSPSGKPGVVFDATRSTSMACTAFGSVAKPFTAVVVASLPNAGGTWKTAASLRNAGDYVSFTANGTTPQLYDQATRVSAAAFPLPQAVAVWEMVYAVGSWTMYRNGSQVGTSSASVATVHDVLILGRSYANTEHSSVTVFEAITYAGALSAGERSSLTSYLTTKWGVA